MKRLFCLAILLMIVLLCPILSGAENLEVDSRVARVISTFGCGCKDVSYGAMVSRNGLITRSEAMYCKDHGKKFTQMYFYFGFADDETYVTRYDGKTKFRAYEQFGGGYKADNDIAYVRFAEPIGDQTGWYACKAASDDELRNARLFFRSDNEKSNFHLEVSSANIRDKKILTFDYTGGTATGIPVLMEDGNGDVAVIGLGISYNPDDGKGFIRRITPRVYGDMTSDGLFKGSAAASAPSVTSLYVEDDEVGTGDMDGPSQAAGDESWTCTACGAADNAGDFCVNCGAARPAEEWTCAVCGQTGNTGRFCPGCGTARDADNGTPEAPQAAVNPNLEQIPGESERVKIRLQGVDASVYIEAGENPNKWAPGNAADGNETTCWQYNGSGGAWLELNTGTGETVDEIWFKNGFWAYNDKGKDQYSINARPKDVRVEFCYAGENLFCDGRKIKLKDEWGNDWQKFTLERHEGVTAVRITVESIYKGSYFKNDVCLSEVMLVQHASAATAMPAGDPQSAVVYESRPEVTGCELLDRLSTRSGPGNTYQEPGTFFRKNTWKGKTVRVLKKASGNGVWWVQVDFRTDNGNSYRVWTGKKRVDVDLDRVPEEIPVGDCDIYPTSDTRWGPGGSYAAANISIRTDAVGILYGIENGWADVEYFGDDGSHGRVWVPQSAIHGVDTNKDRSGEN